MSWGCLQRTGCGCLIITVIFILAILATVAFILLGGWVYLYEHVGWVFKAADKYGIIHLPWYLKL